MGSWMQRAVGGGGGEGRAKRVGEGPKVVLYSRVGL